MEKRFIIKSTGVIGSATLLSRVLGFARDIIIAKFFGTGIFAQAFVVAFRIPNMLRDLIGEGATNAAFVPVLTEYKTLKSEEEYWDLARILFNILGVTLSVAAVIGVISSPFLVRLIAPGFIKEPEKLAVTIKLARMLFPYLIFIGLSAYGMSILNSLKHFAVPAFGASLLNISLIVSALFLCPKIGVTGLAIGVLAGGILQFAAQIPVLYKKGLRIGKAIRFAHPAAKRVGTLLLPRMLGTAVYQINIFVDTILASLSWIVGAGGVAALYYSNRLLQFPLAIFALALAQATLPTMSAQAAKRNMEHLKTTLSFSLRSVFFIMVPSSVGLIVLGRPIVKILFERGEFNAYSTDITYTALLFYCFGLFAYAGIKILVNSFYSLNDTLTPVKTAGISLVVNVALNVILMWPLKIGGLALATSIAGTCNFFLLFFMLQKKIGKIKAAPIVDSFVRVFLASAVMGVAANILLTRNPYFDLGQAGHPAPAVKLFMLIGASISVFMLAAFVLRVKELEGIFQGWMSKNR